MQTKYDFQVDVCSRRHKHRPFTVLFATAKRFGLENAPVKKGFSTSKKCKGGKKIIGRLHSKINTVRRHPGNDGEASHHGQGVPFERGEGVEAFLRGADQRRPS